MDQKSFLIYRETVTFFAVYPTSRNKTEVKLNPHTRAKIFSRGTVGLVQSILYSDFSHTYTWE